MPGAAPARAVGDSLLARAFSNDTLHLIVLPTEQCNFRCTYCYEDFEIGKMRPEIVGGVKRLLSRRLDGLRRLDISWFGGEPLMALDVIEEISRHVTENASGTRYWSDVTTNGSLLSLPTAARLASYGVSVYQVSLDGPAQIHDTTRVRRNGAGTFAAIWSNLCAIRDSDLPVQVLLRIHLTSLNIAAMPDFLRRIRRTLLDDPRFSVRLKAIERLGGPNDESLAVLPHAGRDELMASLEDVLGRDPHASGATEDVCYAAEANSFVVRANGDLGKCTVGLNDPANRIGRVLPDGTVQVDNARLAPWLRGWGMPDQDALACPYAGMDHTEQSLLQITPRGPYAATDERRET
ncbi:radical SAM protein [Nocardioides sp. Iso805N]|uniref:radical SAM protein n=1 Tax=Nocardioides sp. Iso805N TaxID=1283287 RepID=UPI0003819A60|nr:radical SAM protein [Nocardioides sp. Iso805N]